MDVTIDGAVTGQAVVGDHNVVINATHGSTITMLGPGELPRPVRRARIILLPQLGPPPVGRAGELDRLVAMAGPGGLIHLYGEPGIGKSTVLRGLAGRLAERGDAVVFLDGGGRDSEDLLQAVFECCYDSTGYRPSDIELRRLMTGLRISLIIDDLRAPEELLDAVPDACLIWSSAHPVSSPEAQGMRLSGLARADAVSLLERRLGRPLAGGETATAEALWAFAGGRPSSIVRALAALDGQGVLPSTPDGLLTVLLPHLDGWSRRALGLLHAVRPAAITYGLLRVMLPGQHSIDPLVHCGLVIAGEDGLRIAADVDLPADLSPDPDRVADVINNLLAWLRPPVTAARLGADGPAIARLIDRAIECGHPDLAQRLARAAAPPVGASVRWGAWRDILAGGMTAAKQTGDHRALAYFAHEDGIRLLGLGKRVAAGVALGTAIALWRHLGDRAGQSASEQAQQLAIPQPPDPGLLPDDVWPSAGNPDPDPTTAAGTDPPDPPDPGFADPGPAQPTAGSATPGPQSAGSSAPDPSGSTGSSATSTASATTSTASVASAAASTAAATSGGSLLGGLLAIAAAVIGFVILDNVTQDDPAPSSSGPRPAEVQPQTEAQLTPIYYVIRSKHLFNTGISGGHAACRTRTAGEPGVSVTVTVCTELRHQANGVDVGFQLTSGDSTSLRYWGCREPAPASTCHINIDGSPRTICLTTNRDDSSNQTACSLEAGRTTPDGAPTPS